MTQTITYKFFAAKQQVVEIDLAFDDTTYLMQVDDSLEKPDWAKLSHHKCANCPLDDDVEWCPAAVAISQFLPYFKE